MRYAIAFDLDQSNLEKTYPTPSYTNAYGDIKKFLETKGFARQQGSVYFGDETVDAVKAVIAIQKLSKKFPWFHPSITDIRLLRIEDDNDLLPAIESYLED